MKRVVVGMSGGVDSSVAAYLLKEQGYEVVGLFMKNWHDESVTLHHECPWIEDSNDAMIVAERLGIPFQTIDLSEAYKQRIVDYMFSEYEKGRTPNPDVLCNREIKFDVFLKAALKLGADYVATGHYCQKQTSVVNGRETHHLLAGKDTNKDQSYFLCQLSQEQLAKALFPIGGLTKPEVRQIAREQDLITAEKKDSQGLCFVGKISLPDFLQQKLMPKKGAIVEIPENHPVYAQPVLAGEMPSVPDWKRASQPYRYSPDMGKVVGEHTGAHYFTVGQRKGLQVGGKPKPLFVLATDTDANVIYVGQGEEHPGLHRRSLLIQPADIHWVRPDMALQLGESARYWARIRYRQALQPVVLHQELEGLYLHFDEPQKSITPGQFAAWYHEGELIGSGVIHG